MVIRKVRIKSLKFKIWLLCAVVLTSCSFQQRIYNKGFYVSKTHAVDNTKIEKKASFSLAAKEKAGSKNIKTTLIASAKKENVIDFLSSKNKAIDGCDTIFLKSGAKIYAHITQVNLTKVLFENCGQATEETILFIKKSDVSYIAYANGTKELYDTETDLNQPKNLPGQNSDNANIPNYYNNQPNNNNSNNIPNYYDSQPNNPKNTPNYNDNKQHNSRSHNYQQEVGARKKLNPFSLIGFLLGAVQYPFILILAAILGLGSVANHQNLFSQIFSGAHWSPFFILPLLLIASALVFSIIAIYQINKSPDNKKGLKLAYVALILSCLLLLMYLLIIF